MISTIYIMFLAVGAGMTLIRDAEQKVGEIIHSTPLKAGEYVWGKFLAVLGAFVAVLAVHTVLMVFFNHGVPHGENVDVIGPFALANYLRPALLFGLPVLVFIAGVSFAFGALTRQPILVFLVPITVVLGGVFFFWDWSPSWLSPGVNRALMLVDMTGYRWLKETWLDVDRGVSFYNRAHVGVDGVFFLNRALCFVLGLGAVQLAAWRFGKPATASPKSKRKAAAAEEAVRTEPLTSPVSASRGRVPGFPAGAFDVAWIELRELVSQPGLYLFVPLILIQTFGSAITTVGAFDAPLLHTPGTLSSDTMNTLTLLICLLQLFYMVESLQRERGTGFAPIAYATPLRTASLLFGKALANTLVGLAVVGAVLAGCAIDLAVQGRVAFDIRPFLITWGLLLVPTFLVWTTFVSASYAATGNRFGAYGLGLGALMLTGWFQVRGKMNWVANWDLWSSVRWSDMSVYEMDRLALVLNRCLALGLSVFFIALTVRLFARREADPTRILHALRPAGLGRAALGMAPFALAPLVLGVTLWLQVQKGDEVGAGRKRAHDYWKQNVATWADAPIPGLAGVDLDVWLEPQRSAFKVKGEYALVNRRDQPLARIPITVGAGWDSLSWTMAGVSVKPESRSGLYVFTPDHAMQPNDTLRIGFSYQSRFPRAVSKNGGRQMFFVLPSSVVLTGFDGPDFVPIVGFLKEIGIEKENRTDPKVFPADFYLGVTPAFITAGEQWYPVKMRVDLPADFRANAPGVLLSDEVKGNRRVMRWETDHPVRLFNLIAGRWKEKKGDGVTLYYHPAHGYNVDEMMQAMEGARRYFSEWFTPYPWRDLRLSEFPDLARYAQGPPSNITFSEGIGFLTKSEPKANLPFFVTAHEAAHQWWGNILMPAYGPGGVILSEGMAHYSTILLTEQVKGLEQRIAFCKNIEDRYGNTRRSDDESPLLKTLGEKDAERTVIYDKGGWVMWMLTQVMGREATLAGLKEFIAKYRDDADHPALQDLIATLRPHAPDAAAFDAFVKQWFEQVVVPEYKLADFESQKVGNEWIVTAKVRNEGTGIMPVEVAAVRGERFPAKAVGADKKWKESRTTVLVGSKGSADVRLTCAFEPERLVVDPDATGPQLQRAKAAVRLLGRGGRARVPAHAREAARIERCGSPWARAVWQPAAAWASLVAPCRPRSHASPARRPTNTPPTIPATSSRSQVTTRSPRSGLRSATRCV